MFMCAIFFRLGIRANAKLVMQIRENEEKRKKKSNKQTSDHSVICLRERTPNRKITHQKKIGKCVLFLLFSRMPKACLTIAIHIGLKSEREREGTHLINLVIFGPLTLSLSYVFAQSFLFFPVQLNLPFGQRR